MPPRKKESTGSECRQGRKCGGGKCRQGRKKVRAANAAKEERKYGQQMPPMKMQHVAQSIALVYRVGALRLVMLM